MSETTETAPKAKSGGLVKIIAIVAVTGLVAAGGAWWWLKGARAEAAGEHEAPKVEASRGLIKFEPFVVNLADGNGSRFLRTTLQLVVTPEDHAKEIGENAVLMSELRSALLELLAEQQAAALVTPEGKAAMKAAIISRAQEALNGGKIADVLFSEFVVQF
jgi:flagellar basal body-associated protein FliL